MYPEMTPSSIMMGRLVQGGGKWLLLTTVISACLIDFTKGQVGKTTQCWECEGESCNPLGRKRACNFDYCVETYHDDTRTHLLRRGCGNFYGPGCVWDNGEYHCFCLGDLCNRRLERTVDAAPPSCLDIVRNFLTGPGGLFLLAFGTLLALAAMVALFHKCPEPEKLNVRQCKERAAQRVREQMAKEAIMKEAAEKSAQEGGLWKFCD